MEVPGLVPRRLETFGRHWGRLAWLALAVSCGSQLS